MTALSERVLRGEVRAAARLMRDLDDRLPEAEATLRALFPRTGRAYVIGLTGAPGAGKSSLTDRLIAHHRRAGRHRPPWRPARRERCPARVECEGSGR